MNDHSNRRRRTLIESDPTDLVLKYRLQIDCTWRNVDAKLSCGCQRVVPVCLYWNVTWTEEKPLSCPDVDVVLKLYSAKSVYEYCDHAGQFSTDIFSFQSEGCKCNCWKNPNPLSSTTNPVDATHPQASSTDACRSCSHPLSKAHQFSDFLSSLFPVYKLVIMTCVQSALVFFLILYY